MDMQKPVVYASDDKFAESAAPGDSELRAYVVSHIDEAVEKGWIRPYYQPVVRTLTGKLCGWEALARWEDPTLGLLTPDKFIPALEDARLIHKLDSAIVRQVCRQYRRCKDIGEPTVPVSFNLSRLDFDLCDIFAVVEQAAHRYGVPRRMLNIEITETVLGTDPVFMTGMVDVFHNAGYQVWMDDFGSGYSTLNVLKDFDFDELKIDMEFLNRFGEKSKTILASVVDMAKKLGIQTLAEGVETEEHRVYLSRIGCEKMQGYLFGKPRPYALGNAEELYATAGVETIGEQMYLSELGAVNTLSMSERDLMAGNNSHDYVTSMSLAIMEFEGDRFRVLDSNRVFREGLANVGICSIDEAERRLNDPNRVLGRQARLLVQSIEKDKYARIEYMAGATPCVVRAKHITTREGKVALLVSVDDTIEQSKHRRHDRMDELLSVMYTIYEHVDVIHLDERYIEPVFGNIGLRTQFKVDNFDDVTDSFAQAEVYVRDRARYKEFMDHDTMVERIKGSGENYLVGFFRLRQRGGDYAWKLFGLIRLLDQPGNQVMLCIRSTHWASDGLLQAAFDENYGEGLHSRSNEADFAMTDGSLWRALVRDRDLALFWKDSERRFVGANRAFLDYYGFGSADELIGKTDEEMGWHVDPVAFKDDELEVLREGVHVENARGHCIAHGEMRDILATKHPVYRSGRIVGLVGRFADASTSAGEASVDGASAGADSVSNELPLRDGVTGTLNYTGLEAATWRFVDAYKRQGIDFAMISVNIESFQAINDTFGYAFGEKVLGRIGRELRDMVGNRRVIGHVYAERFVILSQRETDEELQELCDEIERRLMSIARVDGTPCTVYALAGFVRFSALGDVEDMKRYNRDKRLARREKGEGGMEGNDVITSLVLP